MEMITSEFNISLRLDNVMSEVENNKIISKLPKDFVNRIESDLNKIVESGTYVVISAPQVGRKSGNGPGSVDFWLRKNQNDIANSNVRLTIRDDDHKDVIVNQMMMPFQAGDVLNVMMAVERTGEGLGIEAIRTEGRPLIPSIIFSMHKIKDHTEGHWVTTQKGTKKVWVEGN
jgi:hypothetical protein